MNSSPPLPSLPLPSPPQSSTSITTVDGLGKKVRKPYTITKSLKSWTEEEHDKFLEALQLFDMVLFYKGKNEKLAYGLFKPFIYHLKFARYQISKSGYSITLQPPTLATPWFTKATFERFVCFVSTPKILEKFVTIEREILQIERSVQANELNANVDGKQEKISEAIGFGL